MARRPSGLMRQLDCLWEGVEQLKSEVEQPTDSTRNDGDPVASPDPGDLGVYFENGLTGP
jgi:hypothetical protein